MGHEKPGGRQDLAHSVLSPEQYERGREKKRLSERE